MLYIMQQCQNPMLQAPNSELYFEERSPALGHHEPIRQNLISRQFDIRLVCSV